MVLATKGRFAGRRLAERRRAVRAPPDPGAGRLAATAGLESVDLYQVHAYDPLTPLEETLRTLDGFIRAGKIRYYGLSNFTGWQLTKACTWPAR